MHVTRGLRGSYDDSRNARGRPIDRPQTEPISSTAVTTPAERPQTAISVHRQNDSTADLRATEAGVAALLDRLDADELNQRRFQNFWHAGWTACEFFLSDRYEAGFADGVMALKRAQHDAHRLAELDALRWSVRGEPRSREDFGDPHPGDYRGGVLPAECPGMVWIAGPPVHGGHTCTRTCWRIKPGLYASAEAAEILEQLPGDYADAIASLRGVS